MNNISILNKLQEYKNPLVIFLTGTLTGATFYFRSIELNIFFSLIFFTLFLFLFLRKKVLLLVLLSVLFGYFYLVYYSKSILPDIDEILNQRFTFMGEIASDMDGRSLYNKKYLFVIKKIIGSNQNKDIKVQVVGSKYEEYSPGDLVQLRGRLKYAKSAGPGEFNNKKYLLTKGVKYLLIADSGTLIYLDSPLPTAFIRNISIFRDFIIKKSQGFIENNSLIHGILFGSKASNLDKDLKEKILTLGLSHITSASGFNVSILAGFVFFLFRLISENKYVPVVISITLVIIYAAMAGFSESVVRAMLIALLVLIGSLFGKKIKILPGMALIILIFFLSNPYSVLSVGFQLSCLAFLGIILFYMELHNLLSTVMNKYLFFFVSIFFQSLIAQIMVIPLIAFYFHNVQIMGLISNLIAVPIAALILVIGLLSIPVSFFQFLLPLYQLICNILNFLLLLFVKWMDLLYIFPYKGLMLPDISFYLLIILYVFIFSFLSFILIKLASCMKH